MVGLLLLSHSNLSNVQLLHEWLEKAIVCHVIANLGEQKGGPNIRNCFIDKAVA